jgi:hypothetical protein
MTTLALDLDSLAVETFDAAAALPPEVETERSGQRCSAVDACPSARGCSIIAPC